MRSLFAVIVALYVTMSSVAETRITRQWIDGRDLHNDSLIIHLPEAAHHQLIEVCGEMAGVRETFPKSSKTWGLDLHLADGSHRSIILGWGNTLYGDFNEKRFLSVSGLDNDKTAYVFDNVDLYTGANILVVEIDNDNRAGIYVGDDLMNYVGTVSLPAAAVDAVIFSHGKFKLCDACVESQFVISQASGLDDGALTAASLPGQPAPLGLWHYLDRDNDAAYARLGGEYDLIVVSDPHNTDHYLIIYLDGASVNSSRWKKGMIKGRLEPTKFVDRYKLLWYDANFEPVEDETHASVEEGILTIYFPLHHSQLRYCR